MDLVLQTSAALCHLNMLIHSYTYDIIYFMAATKLNRSSYRELGKHHLKVHALRKRRVLTDNCQTSMRSFQTITLNCNRQT